VAESSEETLSRVWKSRNHFSPAEKGLEKPSLGRNHAEWGSALKSLSEKDREGGFCSPRWQGGRQQANGGNNGGQKFKSTSRWSQCRIDPSRALRRKEVETKEPWTGSQNLPGRCVSQKTNGGKESLGKDYHGVWKPGQSEAS